MWQDAPQRRAQLRRLCGAAGPVTVRSCLAAVVLHVSQLHEGAGGGYEQAGGGGGSGAYRACGQGRRLSAEGRCVEDSSRADAAAATVTAATGGGAGEHSAGWGVAELECAVRMGPGYAWNETGGCGCRGAATAGPLGCEAAGASDGPVASGAEGGGAAEGNATGDGVVDRWEALDQACVSEAGPNYEHDGADGCRCRSGYTSDASQDGRTCRLGSHKLCRGAFGSTAEFDGARACRCRAGHVPINGTCVRGSDAVCRSGPLGKRRRTAPASLPPLPARAAPRPLSAQRMRWVRGAGPGLVRMRGCGAARVRLREGTEGVPASD